MKRGEATFSTNKKETFLYHLPPAIEKMQASTLRIVFYDLKFRVRLKAQQLGLAKRKKNNN